MNLIVPDRPDIAGYVPPTGPNMHPCALLGPLWPNDAHMLDWQCISNFFVFDDSRVRRAAQIIHDNPTGARAVLLTGLHANTTHWTGNPPPVGSADWFMGWDRAIDCLAVALRSHGVRRGALIIGQSEHYPLSRWITMTRASAWPYVFCNYFALSDRESPHVYAPDAIAMPGLYATDHRTYDTEHLLKWLRGSPSAIIPWVTEPPPGDEVQWHTALRLCTIAGAETAVLFASNAGDTAANKAAIEREWTKIGNWTGGDITAPPRDQPGVT